MERDLTGKIYRSRDGSPETDRFPVVSRPMCYSFCNTNTTPGMPQGRVIITTFPGWGVTTATVIPMSHPSKPNIQNQNLHDQLAI